MTREEIKAIAVSAMKKLDIYKPYIRAFVDNNKVCVFEGFGGFYIEGQREELVKKRKEIEQEYDVVVYAITHEMTEFGELYSFLFASDNDTEGSIIYNEDGINYCYAYVWNIDDEYGSELGEIGVKSFGGGIKRVV